MAIKGLKQRAKASYDEEAPRTIPLDKGETKKEILIRDEQPEKKDNTIWTIPNKILIIIFIAITTHNAHVLERAGLVWKKVSGKNPSTIECITSEERVKQLTRLLQKKENVALGKNASQSSTGNGEKFVEASDENCGCPLTCTSLIMAGTNSMPWSCNKRLSFLMGRYELKRNEACTSMSNSDSNPCGDGTECDPEKCPQPSVFKPGPAERAVDGKTDRLYSLGSVSATTIEHNPWWQVDLGALCKIENIVVYNRGDDMSYKLRNFHVDVLTLNADDVWEIVEDVYSKEEAGLVAFVTSKKATKGQIVRIRVDGHSSINLAEVEVYGRFIN